LNKNLLKKVSITFILLIVVFGAFSNVNAERLNMTYLYGRFNYINLVNNTNDSLNEVSPSYFDLNSDGSLKLNTVDTNFVNEMHKQNIKVVPFVSNHWDRELGRTALSNRLELGHQILNAINTYNLDGVNIDIENVTGVDAGNYTDFVKILRELLPSNKTISVAVAANPNGWTSGWHASYDYTALAKYSDYLMIMTYDEHYQGGEEGPVASIGFVEGSINYALSKVSKDKIVLGIPFFGRYWKSGSSYGGYGLSLSKVEQLLSNYQNTVTYDKGTESVKAIITIKDSDTKPVINGSTLGAGTYTIWYENETSINAKLDLVNKYDLKGTGSWSLGQEVTSIWNNYKALLNKNVIIEEPQGPFNDVSGSRWSVDAITSVKEKGWMNGKYTNIFDPSGGLKRGEFAAILSRTLGLTEIGDITYGDIGGHWAEQQIKMVTNRGLMQGYGDGSFNPEARITREEVAKVISLLNLEGLENPAAVSFKDITKNSWSYNYIIDAAKKGYLTGYPDETFRPRNEITREEIAVILTRAFN
jgi:spore germination protein YaaH